MITLNILVIVLLIAFAWSSFNTYSNALQIITGVLLFLAISASITTNCRNPYAEAGTDYEKVSAYSYITQNGAIETIQGPFYKDGIYYTVDESSIDWNPFAEFAFVVADLPGNKLDDTVTATCPGCGETVSEDSDYCSHCGCKLHENTEDTQNGETICPSCEAKISEECIYCPKCGSELNLTPTCPNCGTDCDTPYCGSCGTPIEQED